MEIDLTVEEFTEAGALIPSDRLAWPDDPDEALPTGWTFQGSRGGEEQPVSANIYLEGATGHVLVDMLALGVPAAILCRTRQAYLAFVRDWLGPLTEFNGANMTLTEVVGDLAREIAYIADEFSAPEPPLSEPRRRGRQSLHQRR